MQLSLSEGLSLAINRIEFLAKRNSKNDGYESLVEWLIQEGAQLKDLSPMDEYTTSAAILCGYSVKVVKQFLQTRSQSQHKEFYDKVLLLAAQKGRSDLLGYFVQQGYTFAPDIIQKALFYSNEQSSALIHKILIN